MASKGTTLCVVNTSGQDITNIAVSGMDNYDWDGDSRPDHNFQGASLARNDSRCEHEELNKHARSSPYNMTLTFGDGTSLSFRNDQQDAFTKHDRFIDASGSATATMQLYQTSGGDSNAINVQTRQAPDNSGWMGALLDRKPNVTINQITMPGSHDAGMYSIGSTTALSQPEWAQTQNLSILNQLRAGSRYFDLRPYYDGREYHVGHFSSGQGSMGPLLSDILEQVHSFITSPASAKETVFLKFSHTSSGYGSSLPTDTMTRDIVNQIRSVLAPVLYTTTDATTLLAELPLSTLASKVCVVVGSEFASCVAPSAGIFRYTDVPSGGGAGDTPGLDVYDDYAETGTFSTMRDDQLQKLEKFGGYGKSYLFLLSWTLTGSASLLDIEVLAGIANPWLPQFTTSARASAVKPNVVYYDYVNPYLCRCIIDVNA